MIRTTIFWLLLAAATLPACVHAQESVAFDPQSPVEGETVRFTLFLPDDRFVFENDINIQVSGQRIDISAPFLQTVPNGTSRTVSRSFVAPARGTYSYSVVLIDQLGSAGTVAQGQLVVAGSPTGSAQPIPALKTPAIAAMLMVVAVLAALSLKARR